MRCNKVMLEETRDIITVPATFMLKVLASLNQIRAGKSFLKMGFCNIFYLFMFKVFLVMSQFILIMLFMYD